MRRFFFCASVWVLVMLVVPAYLAACPACKTLEDPIGKGFNWSILFMMSMPFVVFTLIGGTVFWCYRRAQRGQIAAETGEIKVTERSKM